MDFEDDIFCEDDICCDILTNDVLQNFPFLEDDIDAITDYELISKTYEYLDDKKANKEDVPKLDDYYNKDEIDNLLDEKVDNEELDSYYNKTEVNSLLDGKADVSDIPDVSDFITKDVNDLTYYTKTSDLSSVATSGDYDDLLNKPTIPTVPTDVSSFNNDAGYITKSVDDLTNYTLTSDLSSVATSGDYDDLLNKPTIPTVPTNVSSFNNDAGYITKSVNDLTNYMLTTTINGYIDKEFKKNDSSILADATITSITPLVGSNYASYSNSYYYKIGSRVHIHLGLSGLTANTLQKVFDIPSGYRPYSHLVSIGQGGGSDIVGQGVIDTDHHSLYVRSPSAYISVDFDYDAFS